MEVRMKKWIVLFVDDDANVLSTLRRALRKEPYRLLFAPGPDEALEILGEEAVDVVVSDYLMHNMDGLSFLQMVKNHYPQILRILLTGHADLQVAIKAINEGEVSRIITKPWRDFDLRVTLRQIFEFLSLRRENQLLQDAVKRQREFLEKLEAENPGILKVKRDENGAIDLEEYSISSSDLVIL
jgi:two-component system probable response regulator PhcQ